MMIETHRDGQLLKVIGRLDANGVRELRKAMQGSRAGRIEIDFTGVADLDEETLPFLTVNLVVARRSGRQVTVHGLREHHVDVLRHYGYEDVREDELPFPD
jgi:anti-anti-sigma regulatory factor